MSTELLNLINLMTLHDHLDDLIVATMFKFAKKSDARQSERNHRHHNSPKTAHAGGFLVQGHPAAARGLFPIQEPPKTRALASGDLRSYAPGRLGPMRKTRKQDSKNFKKIATGPLQAC